MKVTSFKEAKMDMECGGASKAISTKATGAIINAGGTARMNGSTVTSMRVNTYKALNLDKVLTSSLTETFTQVCIKRESLMDMASTNGRSLNLYSLESFYKE
jgi:hypothetical protein